ncbi:MAG: ribosome silencing factor [Alphaproteobacteria bacterium]|nr:ribosome silencing factor [Alphaproteobacteria bacterium]
MLGLVETTLDDDQAEDVRIISLAGKADFADYMVIASGSSRRKVAAMATHLTAKLKKKGVTGLSIEGRTVGDWVLLDAGAIIIHLFRPETRAYYDLEKLWEPDIAGPRRPEPAVL